MHMTAGQRIQKRCFDIVLAAICLSLLWPIIAICWVLAARDTGAGGFFKQRRVGKGGHSFTVYKLRTMRNISGTTITTKDDTRITPLGANLRRLKLDELPQLWNVLIGDMSFVGPRPDVPGYLDKLTGDERDLLQLRPGMTGPATLKYRNEEEILAAQNNPEEYNDFTIWPDKVQINLEYLKHWSFRKDLAYLLVTLRGSRDEV